MSDRLRLAIIGDGKMGRAVSSLAADERFDVVAMLGITQVASAGITPASLAGADVAIEFTVPSAAASNVRACVAAHVPVVSGTTGWDAARATVEEEIRLNGGALLWAPNFSLGVQLFACIIAEASRMIARADAGFDVQQIETHHRAKLDAPSGTARLLADAAKLAFGRDVPTTSVRTGSVPGTHEFIFDAPFEQIRLEHVARDRRVFATGALHAARWIAGRQGVFTFSDLLGPRT